MGGDGGINDPFRRQRHIAALDQQIWKQASKVSPSLPDPPISFSYTI